MDVNNNVDEAIRAVDFLRVREEKSLNLILFLESKGLLARYLSQLLISCTQ